MRGFIQGGLVEDADVAIQFYSNAIKVMEWGQIVWKDHPRCERGTVFDKTFARGVRKLRLDALLGVRAHFIGCEIGLAHGDARHITETLGIRMLPCNASLTKQTRSSRT